MVVPAATPVYKPLVVVLTVATLALDVYQFTDDVKFWVLLSLYVPVATNCSVAPAEILGLAGVTAMLTKLGLPLPVRFAV